MIPPKKNKPLHKKPISESTLITRALRILSIRAHSKKELFGKLKKAFPEISPTMIDQAILRLEEVGYINEEDITKQLTEYWILKKQQGITPLKNRLYLIGIPEIHIRSAELIAEDLLPQAIEAYIAKQLRTLPESLTTVQKHKKILERGMRRGFSYEQLQRALHASETPIMS